ncbi:hypothetical protein OPT61_g3265 [Boeremia exigua]|uniref:Uncharacterized protein n=1 Tax=Boeremia exigua TaxID=749465 RepID=A0ACC2III8_9PLEO|nr:hypothetical protein OPT61_g3265 [Boeremia exigua]
MATQAASDLFKAGKFNTMSISKTPTDANWFVRNVRKVYNPIGFKRGYTFTFFFITVGALFGFSVARLKYTFAFSTTFCSETGDVGAAPGECYYYKQSLYNTGIKLHLYTIIPAALLACVQFVPVIRHRFIIVHRVNGYLVLVLAYLGLISAFMILRRAFGGGLDVQLWGGVAGTMSAVSLGLSYYNVKKLQIEEHRKWMLRAWAYLGTIITMRLIFVIMAAVISKYGDYYQPRECGQIQFLVKSQEELSIRYPECSRNASSNALTLVRANFSSSAPEEATVALGISFGSAAWLALTIHAVLVELYINLTPAEHHRLRKISYQRQLEAGVMKAGNAGFTAQRCGDSDPWMD